MFARFGVDVTIVEARERLLSLEEPEASELVAAAFDAEGIVVRTDVVAERVEPDPTGSTWRSATARWSRGSDCSSRRAGSST